MKKLLAAFFLCVMSLPLSAQILSIYGGKDNEVFLGYLNASKYDSKSIWNESGTYGNKYSSKSIWNTSCPYGNKYSQYSPWNNSASNPPILRDKNGVSYGYLTVNKYKTKRATNYTAIKICDNYETIIANVGTWYDQNMK